MENDKSYNTILNYIKERFESKNLKLGEKIETERELAEKLKLSRSAVRETLKILRAMGIISCIQGSGYYLRKDFKNALFENFNLFFLLTGKKISELMDFREGIELKAFELALTNMTEDDEQNIEKIFKKLKDTENEEESSMLDAEFHRVIVEASHNIFFIGLYNSSRQTLENAIKNIRESILKNKENKKTLLEQHEKIYQALIEKNLKLGDETIKEHFSLMKKNIF